MAKWSLCYIKRSDFVPTGLLSPAHIAKSRAIHLIPSSVSPYRSHCRTLGELLSSCATVWSQQLTCFYTLMTICYWFTSLIQYRNHFCKNIFVKLSKKTCFFFLPCEKAQCVQVNFHWTSNCVCVCVCWQVYEYLKQRSVCVVTEEGM